MAETPKKKRQPRTDWERATEALGVVERKLKRARAKHAEAKKEADAALLDVQALTERRDFLANDPALSNQPGEPVQGVGEVNVSGSS